MTSGGNNVNNFSRHAHGIVRCWNARHRLWNAVPAEVNHCHVLLLIPALTGDRSEEPRFTWSSTDSVTVIQGDNLTLECAAHGVPTPQLSWEKYGGHVPYGRHSLLLGETSDERVLRIIIT